MSIPYSLTLLSFGILLGALLSWFLLRSRNREKLAVLPALDNELMLLRERLTTRDATIAELKLGLIRTGEQIETLRSELKNETELRLNAEARNNHLESAVTQLNESRESGTRLHGENMALRARIAELEQKICEEKERSQEKLTLLNEARQELSNTFKALSTDIFNNNSSSFLELAKATFGSYQEKSKSELEQRQQAIAEMVKPLQESLQKVDTQVRLIENDRTQAYATLLEQVKSMAASQAQLQGETANLVRSLRSPTVRGRWGEIQLRRVVEMAGMVEYCDFIEQESRGTDDGRLRPDMVIKLPNHKNIVVDSKAALMAYLESLEAKDEPTRLAKLQEHARQIRNHLNQLASKFYWEQFQPTPEFVVLFLPGENFFSAALEQDPELIEFGVKERVILATPTTLIALLRSVSYGWRQERMTEHAQAIGELGRLLYSRLNTMGQHFEALRKGIERTVESYNKTVGSFEGRVLITARKFIEIDPLMSTKIEPLKIIDKIPRPYQSELVHNDEEDIAKDIQT